MMQVPLFVCIVPLAEEMEHIDNELRRRNARYEYGHFDRKRTEHTYTFDLGAFGAALELRFHVLPEMGNLTSAAAARSALVIDQNADAIFVVGIAGSLEPAKSRLADVVLSSSVAFIGPDKVKQREEGHEIFGDAHGPTAGNVILDPRKRLGYDSWLRFRRDGLEFLNARRKISKYLNAIRGNPSNLAAVSGSAFPEDLAAYANDAPSVLGGTVLGSDWVIDSPEFAKFLLERYNNPGSGWYAEHGDAEERKRILALADDVVCLDMESYGFFRGVAEEDPLKNRLAFSVRGISDPCRDKKRLDKTTRSGIRAAAAGNAAKVLVDFCVYLRLQEFSRNQGR